MDKERSGDFEYQTAKKLEIVVKVVTNVMDRQTVCQILECSQRNDDQVIS